MLNILSLDIGGANIKALKLSIHGCDIKEFKTLRFYWPIWKLGKNSIEVGLKKVVNSLGYSNNVLITMTAELSDVFKDKVEGVHEVLKQVKTVFRNSNVKVLTVNGDLVDVDYALNNPLEVASANWYATGYLASKYRRSCIVVDIGSTTTSIIPVVNGVVNAIGKNDVEKLAVGELVYTGVLRTNLATVTNYVPLRGKMVRVSSELFALTGDVYLVLNLISEEMYVTETADGRGRSISECMDRISRLICGDRNLLTPEDVILIAKYIHYKQIFQIAEAIWQVYTRIKHLTDDEISAIVTGLGKEFLAKKACELVGFHEILDLDLLLGVKVAPVAPCAGLASIYLDSIGVNVKWMQ